MTLAEAMRVPVEDGVTHPAEALLRAAHIEHGDGWIDTWLIDWITQEKPPPAALVVVSRLSLPRGGWARRVLASHILRGEVAAREAAIQAVETWGDKRLLSVLAYDEPEPWLAEYRDQVRADLEAL